MNNNRRYLGMVFVDQIDKIIPTIEKHVNIDLPNYHLFKVSDNSLTFISFYSTNEINVIKNSIKEKHKKVEFLLFDVTNQGDTFDMNCKGLENYILLTNLNDVEAISPNIKDSEIKLKPMDLDSLLELVNKNGMSALDEDQKNQLRKYSEE